MLSSKRPAWCNPVKIFEFLDEMRLVVVARVVKQLILPQALGRRFGAEDILEAHHLGKRLS